MFALVLTGRPFTLAVFAIAAAIFLAFGVGWELSARTAHDLHRRDRIQARLWRQERAAQIEAEEQARLDALPPYQEGIDYLGWVEDHARTKGPTP